MQNSSIRRSVVGAVQQHLDAVEAARSELEQVLPDIVELLIQAVQREATIFAVGNGGSSADAQHFVAELVGRFGRSRRPIGALVLGTDPATSSAVGNDFGFDEALARQFEALARPGDVLMALSTSGNSQNVLTTASTARRRGCVVIAFTGPPGSRLPQLADVALQVPSQHTARIQEVHGVALHLLAEMLDDADERPMHPEPEASRSAGGQQMSGPVKAVRSTRED